MNPSVQSTYIEEFIPSSHLVTLLRKNRKCILAYAVTGFVLCLCVGLVLATTGKIIGSMLEMYHRYCVQIFNFPYFTFE